MIQKKLTNQNLYFYHYSSSTNSLEFKQITLE